MRDPRRPARPPASSRLAEGCSSPCPRTQPDPRPHRSPPPPPPAVQPRVRRASRSAAEGRHGPWSHHRPARDLRPRNEATKCARRPCAGRRSPRRNRAQGRLTHRRTSLAVVPDVYPFRGGSRKGVGSGDHGVVGPCQACRPLRQPAPSPSSPRSCPRPGSGSQNPRELFIHRGADSFVGCCRADVTAGDPSATAAPAKSAEALSLRDESLGNCARYARVLPRNAQPLRPPREIPATWPRHPVRRGAPSPSHGPSR